MNALGTQSILVNIATNAFEDLDAACAWRALLMSLRTHHVERSGALHGFATGSASDHRPAPSAMSSTAAAAERLRARERGSRSSQGRKADVGVRGVDLDVDVVVNLDGDGNVEVAGNRGRRPPIRLTC